MMFLSAVCRQPHPPGANNNMPRRVPRPTKREITDTKQVVDDLYKNSRAIIKEFVDDGVVSGFRDIPMNVWYNALSSVCALAMRVPAIKNQERLQEAVVYQVMRLVILHDLPVDEEVRNIVLAVYERIAPTAIDILIPGEGDACCCGFLLRRG